MVLDGPQICKVAGKLAHCVLLHAPGDVDNIQKIRKLFCSLSPRSQNLTESANAGSSSYCRNKVASGVAGKIAAELMNHSVLATPFQDGDSRAMRGITDGATCLSRPADSILPVMETMEVRIHNAEMEQESVRIEAILLLKALLTMQESFHPEQSLDPAQASTEANCLASLLAGYEATLCGEDVAALAVIQILDSRLHLRSLKAQAHAACRPLERVGYCFGATAKTLHLEGRLVPQMLTESGGDVAAESMSSFHEFRTAAMENMPVVSHCRCAMTSVFYPEGRSLAVREGSQDIWLGAPVAKERGGLDPAFMIPYCKTGLSQGWLHGKCFWRSGLLGLCLRASSAEDEAIRLHTYPFSFGLFF